MSAPLVFMDTETTGLTLEDHVWEFAAVLRRRDGSELVVHEFVEHDMERAAALPDSFRADHDARYNPEVALGVDLFADLLGDLFHSRGERLHVVGCVPNFDTERLARIMRYHGYEPGWHHHLIDVENLAVGYLRGLTAEYEPEQLAPPWDSDELSRKLHVEPPGDGVRHTAMGDVRWAMAIYDVVMGA